jgi:hypothetical protein
MSGGVLSAVPLLASRQYGMVLTQAPDGTYAVPLAQRNKIALHRNGLRQTPNEDYSYAGGVVKPLETWATDDLVVCDGE